MDRYHWHLFVNADIIHDKLLDNVICVFSMSEPVVFQRGNLVFRNMPTLEHAILTRKFTFHLTMFICAPANDLSNQLPKCHCTLRNDENNNYM